MKTLLLNNSFLLCINFIIISLLSCGKDSYNILQNPYITRINNRQVYWALGEVDIKEIQVPKVLLLEKSYTNVYSSNNPTYTLYRIVNTKLLGDMKNEILLYADYHPQDLSKILAYNYSIIYKSNEKMVYLYLYKAGPSYKNDLNEISSIVPIGRAYFFDNTDRTYVYLNPNIYIGIVSSGPYKNRFVIYYNNEIAKGRIQDLSSLCSETHKSSSNSLIPNNIIFSNIYCNQKPEDIDICAANPLSDATCIPPSPIGDDFNLVGYIDTTNLIKITNRQYLLHQQSAFNKKIKITFISKTIKSNPSTNNQLCHDYFEAIGYTIGSRLNPKCNIIPDYSSEPSPAGYLSCSVLMHFNNALTYLEKICYVKGIFTKEYDQAETIQIIKQ